MVEATAELGYAQVTVAETIRRAGVSRETFYEQFANREECFLAAYREAVATLERRLAAALPGPAGAAAAVEASETAEASGTAKASPGAGGPAGTAAPEASGTAHSDAGDAGTDPLDRVDRLIDGYLEALGDPALAWTFLIEINAVGPKVARERAAAQERAYRALGAAAGATDDRQRFACEAVAAATIGLVTQRVASGRAAECRELAGPLKRFARSALAAAGVGAGPKAA